MGQYWIPVNLDKKEYVHPHKLGCGLKLWEQLANNPSTGDAILILCSAMPERRGGGDLQEHPVVGRWAGDRIAWIGDYAEAGDLPKENASVIYEEVMDCHYEDGEGWTDVTDLVCEVIEIELEGKFEGTGWRTFKGKYN